MMKKMMKTMRRKRALPFFGKQMPLGQLKDLKE
jgi:hypothetical protein